VWLVKLPVEDLQPREKVRRLVVLAEVEKSSGAADSKARARDLLDQALALIRSELPDDKHLELQCRHELARVIQFLTGGPAEAIPLYEAIIAEWEQQKRSEATLFARAVALRNLAEALMTVAGSTEAEPERNATLADALKCVNRARDVMPKNSAHFLIAELEYLAGRIAQRMANPSHDVDRFFERCRVRALETNHLMMACIVESRIFWRADPGVAAAGNFDDAGWAERAEALAQFTRHAWAARVLIDGRLKAARRLAARHEPDVRVRAQLDDAVELLDRNRAFDKGSDRARRVFAHAGLSLFVKAAGNKYWTRLLTDFPWARDWLVEHQVESPEQAWRLIE
jgi:tetratricopeptide (TPR) repeat protein